VIGTTHPDDRDWLRSVIEDAVNTHKPFSIYYRITLPTGEVRVLHARGAVATDEHGNATRLHGTAQDVTERKQAEDELTKEKEILEKIFDNMPVMIGFVGDDGQVKLVNPEWERTIGWTVKELQEQDVNIFVEAYPDPQYRQEVLDFVAESTGELVDLKIKVRDGRVIDAACAVVHLSDGTRVAIAQDITERKRAEEALDERLLFETMLTELSAAFANLSAYEVDRNIDKWLKTLVEFLGVDRAAFLQFEEDWTALHGTHSYTVPGIKSLPPPIEWDVQFPWFTDQLRRGVTIKWPRIPEDMPEEAVNEREYLARLGVKSGLNIPVRVAGSVICAILFSSIATYRDWPDEMVARLRLVGEIFAAGIERKRAEEQLKSTSDQLRALSGSVQAAREEEATRIAREIHDELGGALTSLKWDLEEIDAPVSETGDRPDLQKQRKKVLSMVRLIDATINTVRRIASELRPIGLDDLGLVAAIELHARKFQDRSGIIVECDCALQSPKFSQDQSTAIFRIFQEALTNILRHSQATRVTIQTAEAAGEFILTIVDNGRGITEEERSGSQTLGLLGMRERANLLRGTIDITGSAGKGTVVTLSISTSDTPEVKKANEAHPVS
jgi:PAS domain S-box-containing protein